MNEYSVPNSKALVDFDFDENKVNNVGALSISHIWVSLTAFVVFDCKSQHYLCTPIYMSQSSSVIPKSSIV